MTQLDLFTDNNAPPDTIGPLPDEAPGHRIHPTYYHERPLTRTRLTRDDVERIVSDARQRGKRPNLARADLTGADLRNVNLTGVNLRSAHLQNADLRSTNLCSANLRGTNLRDVNLTGANLRDANLCGADLRYAKFAGTDLRNVNLTGANLFYTDLNSTDLAGANFTGADLSNTTMSRVRGLPVLSITGLPSGKVILLPTPDGWQLHVGSWVGTPDALRELNTDNGSTIDPAPDDFDNNRPLHTAVADLADAFIAAHPNPHFTNLEKDPHHA